MTKPACVQRARSCVPRSRLRPAERQLQVDRGLFADRRVGKLVSRSNVGWHARWIAWRIAGRVERISSGPAYRQLPHQEGSQRTQAQPQTAEAGMGVDVP